jgi:predicted nucleic acid-binding protein
MEVVIDASAMAKWYLREEMGLLEGALSIAFERDLTVCDSIYAALAEALDASLIAYDEKLLENVERSVKAGDVIRDFRDR